MAATSAQTAVVEPILAAMASSSPTLLHLPRELDDHCSVAAQELAACEAEHAAQPALTAPTRLRYVRLYKHLGTLTAANGAISPEIAHRASETKRAAAPVMHAIRAGSYVV